MEFQDVAVLEGGVPAWVKQGQTLERGIPSAKNRLLDSVRRAVRYVQPAELAATLKFSKPLILHVGKSQEFDRGHLLESRWIARGLLEVKIDELSPDEGRAIVVTCSNGRQSTLFA
ncbi:MAG: hypothetical protein QF619_10895 [Candidatus Binatia bacterium]|jgi:3-mercaptopyruvate sulfurtransferase SseA|nr:hypothetical protein [Candidatus Binatia bacterium]